MTNKSSRLTRLAVFAASALLPLTAASADQLNWDDYNTTGATLPLASPYSYNYDIGSTRVNVAITGTTSALSTNAGGTTAPAIGKELEGGLTPTENALQIATNFTANTDTITVTVSFTTLAGVAKSVNGVSFNLFDVDRANTTGGNTSYVDQIGNIQAVLGGNVIRQAVITGTSGGNTVSGNGLTGYAITGAASVVNTGAGSNGANANINFGTQNLSSFSFTYGNNSNILLGTTAQADPGIQYVSLHDVNFTPVAVPEPSTTVTLAMAGVLAGMVFFRRRNAFQRQ